jgi:multidrug resistance efflux pump
MKRMVIVALLVMAGAVAWFSLNDAVNHSLEFYGTIEARHIRVGSLVGGRVAEVLVQEGDSVSAGQLLVRLETALLEPQVREQEARLAEAQAALDRVITGPRKEEINRARIAWERADKDRVRLEGLVAQNLASQKEYDDAQALAQSALETYDELQRGSRSEDERIARSRLNEAEQRLAYLRTQLAETEVKSPADGLLEAFDLRPGDMVGVAAPVALILEPGELWVRFYVPETQLGRVHLGQEAEIEIDSHPGHEFAAQVTDIRHYAEFTPRNVQTRELREDLVFAVKVTPKPAPELKPGMAATVRLKEAGEGPGSAGG